MRTITTFIFLFVSLFAFSQNLKQCLKYAEENSREGDYYHAIKFYEQALQYDSTSVHILYKYAEALRAYNYYDKAVFYYQKVFDKTNGKLYPEAVMWLAVMQKNQGEYALSSKTWKKVRKVLGKKKKEYHYLKSRQEITSCNWAIKRRKDSTEWVISPSEINSDNSEFSPFVFNDNLHYSSMKAEKTDGQVVFDESYRIKVFNEVEALDTIINTITSDNGEACFSNDGQRMYFTRCIEGKKCHIYISRKSGDVWSKPDELGIVNKVGFGSVQPYITQVDDKEFLFFASDQDGTIGGLDIWFSEVSDNGNKYSKPVNLGATVNTMDDDMSPYYNDIEKRLYFSSTWHKGFGGMDIFSSNGTPGSKFSAPRNLGLPMNSRANDMYYKKTTLYKAYLSSNREGSLSSSHPTCCNDIYIVEIPHEEPKDSIPYSSLEDLNRFLPVTLFFHNDRPNPNTLDTFTNLNYVTTYKRYHDMLGEYKQEYSQGLRGEAAEEAQSDMDDFFIEKVDKGVQDLEIFTKLLLIELEKGQKIEMTVQGYASPLAKTEYNVKLTYRRVSSMINFLSEYQNGVIKPYINGTAENGGSLSFNQIPFGEYTANQQISDNPNDQQNSVFSIAAASERKIEIQSVQISNEKDSSYAEIHFNKEIHDFGVMKNNSNKLRYSFEYSNTGTEQLKVEAVNSSCPCLLVEFEPQVLAPGQKASISVVLDPSELEGKNMIKMTVISNGFPKEKQLGLTLDVER